jgi:hypothetical protein
MDEVELPQNDKAFYGTTVVQILFDPVYIYFVAENIDEDTPEEVSRKKFKFGALIFAAIIVSAAIILLLILVIIDTDDTSDCFTWEGQYYCPGDCIAQEGSLYCPASSSERIMLIYSLSVNSEAKCNDGSTPTIHYRESLAGPHEDMWIFRFEGIICYNMLKNFHINKSP